MKNRNIFRDMENKPVITKGVREEGQIRGIRSRDINHYV